MQLFRNERFCVVAQQVFLSFGERGAFMPLFAVLSVFLFVVGSLAIDPSVDRFEQTKLEQTLKYIAHIGILEDNYTTAKVTVHEALIQSGVVDPSFKFNNCSAEGAISDPLFLDDDRYTCTKGVSSDGLIEVTFERGVYWKKDDTSSEYEFIPTDGQLYFYKVPRDITYNAISLEIKKRFSVPRLSRVAGFTDEHFVQASTIVRQDAQVDNVRAFPFAVFACDALLDYDPMKLISDHQKKEFKADDLCRRWAFATESWPHQNQKRWEGLQRAMYHMSYGGIKYKKQENLCFPKNYTPDTTKYPNCKQLHVWMNAGLADLSQDTVSSAEYLSVLAQSRQGPTINVSLGSKWVPLDEPVDWNDPNAYHVQTAFVENIKASSVKLKHVLPTASHGLKQEFSQVAKPRGDGDVSKPRYQAMTFFVKDEGGNVHPITIKRRTRQTEKRMKNALTNLYGHDPRLPVDDSRAPVWQLPVPIISVPDSMKRNLCDHSAVFTDQPQVTTLPDEARVIGFAMFNLNDINYKSLIQDHAPLESGKKATLSFTFGKHTHQEDYPRLDPDTLASLTNKVDEMKRFGEQILSYEACIERFLDKNPEKTEEDAKKKCVFPEPPSEDLKFTELAGKLRECFSLPTTDTIADLFSMMKDKKKREEASKLLGKIGVGLDHCYPARRSPYEPAAWATLQKLSVGNGVGGPSGYFSCEPDQAFQSVGKKSETSPSFVSVF